MRVVLRGGLDRRRHGRRERVTELLLHGYLRSSATYRVRIALNLKGLNYTEAFHHLLKGEQRAAGFLALNPQGLVPALIVEGMPLTQSLAICEYLDETHPEPPLLPADPLARARVRAFAQAIACDIHPLQNLKVLERLRAAGLGEEQLRRWAAEAIDEGLDACSRLLDPHAGPYCFGAGVTLADVVLVPQMVNARRFGVELRWPRLNDVETACLALGAFGRAHLSGSPTTAR